MAPEARKAGTSSASVAVQAAAILVAIRVRRESGVEARYRIVPSSRSSAIALAPITTAMKAVIVGIISRCSRRAQNTSGSISPADANTVAAITGTRARRASARIRLPVKRLRSVRT